MRKLNKPLLRRLARKLRRLRHEEHYDQGYWMNKTECGTAACIAGHAALLVGARPLTQQQMDDGEDEQFFCRFKGDVVETVAVAEEALGIPGAHWLFSDSPLDTDFPGKAWPQEYRERWSAAQCDKSERPSRIAADLLDAIADGTVKL